MLRALETELEPLGFRLALSLKISVTLEHFAFLPWFLVPTSPDHAHEGARAKGGLHRARSQRAVPLFAADAALPQQTWARTKQRRPA